MGSSSEALGPTRASLGADRVVRLFRQPLDRGRGRSLPRAARPGSSPSARSPSPRPRSRRLLPFRDISGKHLTRWEATGYLALLLPILASDRPAGRARRASGEEEQHEPQPRRDADGCRPQGSRHGCSQSRSRREDPVAKITSCHSRPCDRPGLRDHIAVEPGTRVRLIGFVVRGDKLTGSGSRAFSSRAARQTRCRFSSM